MDFPLSVNYWERKNCQLVLHKKDASKNGAKQNDRIVEW